MVKRCKFYDMVHSNNAARIRLWLRLKGGCEDVVETILIKHNDLHTDAFGTITPLKKVPAFVTDRGLHLFESYVILQYLEDRFGSSGAPDSDNKVRGPSLVLDTPDDRAFVQLIVRCHDIYISSPNCTQPGFAHTQGCMYLDPEPTQFTPPSRTMCASIRAAKLKEIFEQLTWLEGQVRLPYLAGGCLTHADLTWFPTAVFMELLLPRVFGWSAVFREEEQFPNLSAWFGRCLSNEQFEKVRGEIRGTLEAQAAAGRFAGVKADAEGHPEYKWKYM
jgi:glutathione S-transferase